MKEGRRRRKERGSSSINAANHNSVYVQELKLHSKPKIGAWAGICGKLR